ncbi:hypothetical protein RFI_23579, partial [Reticulomyxa filosa]
FVLDCHCKLTWNIWLAFVCCIHNEYFEHETKTILISQYNKYIYIYIYIYIKVGELKTTPSNSANVPIEWGGKGEKRSTNKKNEIFVDIFERISVTRFGDWKSSGNSAMYGGVVLDDINFHECVRLDEFEQTRTLRFVPPDGEFAVINYRVTNEFRQPFRIFPFFELVSPYKVELIIKIRADIPEQNYGGNVGVELPVPSNCQTFVCCLVTPELNTGVVGQTCEYDLKNRKVVWKVKKFPGGSEQALRVKITFKEQQTTAVRKTIGPIRFVFFSHSHCYRFYSFFILSVIICLF